MNLDRLKYRYWQHTDWHDDKSPLKAIYCNAVDGCDPTIAVSDFEFCTGLKDKNGNLIYEGDIVRCSDGNVYNICWSDSAMIMIAVNTTTKIGDAIYKLKCYDEFEIIGNIHTNKLKKE